MRLLPLLFLASCSCASLREGWVKVDFVEGRVDQYIVCETKIVEGDITAKCVSMKSVAERMSEAKPTIQTHPGDL